MCNDKTAYRGLVIEQVPLIAIHFLPGPQLPLVLFLLRMHLSQHWQGKLHGFSSREINHHNMSVQVTCSLDEFTVNAEKIQYGVQSSSTHVTEGPSASNEMYMLPLQQGTLYKRTLIYLNWFHWENSN